MGKRAELETVVIRLAFEESKCVRESEARP
jgi:hypothetical protein